VGPVPSLTVTVTVEVPAATGVPEIAPITELITRPEGSPVAEYTKIRLASESVATTLIGVIGTPAVAD